MRSDNFISGKEIQTEIVDNGVSRQIMGYDDNIMMVKVDFQQGAIGSVHKHSNAQVTYVVSGKFELEIHAEKRIVEAGDGFYVEPDVLHGIVCLESGSLIDVFNPVRSEFLVK